MYLDEANAILIFKGINNPALQPVVLEFIKKISKVKQEANHNLDTIESVLEFVAKSFYERKRDLEGTYYRIEKEKAKNEEIAFIEILTHRTEGFKKQIVETAKNFLEFNFVNISKNPVNGQNVISMVDMLDIRNVDLGFYLFSNKYQDYCTQKISCADVIYDCFETKNKFEKELANENVSPKITEQEVKAETKFTEDVANYFLAS